MMQTTAAEFPNVEIGNGQATAKVYLPDAKKGFYRGTRFDWSGVIGSLQAHGHDYYGPWFDKTDPAVHDFVYRGEEIVVGPCSASTGPVNEFGPLGWNQAKAGGTFVKIGVGALRKPDNGKYDNYRLYEIADGGTWTVKPSADAVEFTQELTDTESSYGYVYRKVVRLAPGKTEMVLEQSLKNTGKRAIETSVYNHNFLVLDKQAPGAGVTIRFPFAVRTEEPPEKGLAEIRGNEIVYLKKLAGEDKVAMPIQGFGSGAQENGFRIDSAQVGAGMQVSMDQPLLKESLWSIRTVIAVEPFVQISIAPGQEFRWASRYEYFSLKGR